MKHHIVLRLLILLFFAFTFTYARSQSASEEEIRISLGKHTAFDSTMLFLLDRKYFIQTADKASGLIQYVVNKKKSNFFGTRDGDRYIVNLFFREVRDNETGIYQQINVEHRIYKNYILYLDDQGITSDPKIYQPYLDDLVFYLLDASGKD